VAQGVFRLMLKTLNSRRFAVYLLSLFLLILGYLMRAMKLIMSSSFIVKKLGIGTLGKVPAKIEELMAKVY
jgi:hypothetical protein